MKKIELRTRQTINFACPLVFIWMSTTATFEPEVLVDEITEEQFRLALLGNLYGSFGNWAPIGGIFAAVPRISIRSPPKIFIFYQPTPHVFMTGSGMDLWILDGLKW